MVSGGRRSWASLLQKFLVVESLSWLPICQDPLFLLESGSVLRVFLTTCPLHLDYLIFRYSTVRSVVLEFILFL